MSKQSTLPEESAQEFAEQLLVANDADETHGIIEQIESRFDVEWKSLGGEDQNNYATVHNQASSPMAAFVELLLNSADAQMFKFYDKVSDQVPPDKYTSMKAAMEADWVDVDDATIETLVDGSQASKGNFVNLTIRDDGMGKDPENFSDFVSLHSPGLKKQDYGFCQGQYGMGSTGVLPFCGDTEAEINDRCFKLIVSASAKDPEKWSWTIVRDNQNETDFEYLTISGDFPRFNGEFGGAIVEKLRESYPDKYDIDKNITPPESQSHGTFIKVYEYETHASRTFLAGTEGWRRKFERFVVDSPFPIRITDMRSNSKAPQTTTRGFLPHLRNGNEDVLKDEEHLRVETGSEQVGTRDAHVLLFKSDSELDGSNSDKSNFVAQTTNTGAVTGRTGIQRDHAVMLTINGQTHGSKGEFFLRQQGYSKIASDTVVIVEFDDLANLGAVKMFSPSRDELKDSAQTRKFISGLEDALDDSDLLTEEEERRRRSRGSDDENVDNETLQEFVERRPDVAQWIAEGKKVEAAYLLPDENGDQKVDPDKDGPTEGLVDGPGDDVDTEDTDAQYEPKLPTYFRLIEEYDPDGDHRYWDDSRGFMPVDLPVNGLTKIRMETDAQDNYLARDVLAGSLSITPSARYRSVELHDGILTVTIEPEENAEPGDDFGLIIQLNRPDLDDCDKISNPADAFPKKAAQPVNDGEKVDTSPLKTDVRVQYTEKEETPSYTTTDSFSNEDENPDDSGDDSATDDSEPAENGEGSGNHERTLDMPDIDYVTEEQWREDDDDNPIYEEDYDPEVAADFDESTIVRIEPSPDNKISGLSITINRDSAPLRRFIVTENVKNDWKEFVERRYEIAVVYYAISQYRQLKGDFGDQLDQAELLVSDLVESGINGIGQTLMPTIISDDQLENITD